MSIGREYRILLTGGSFSIIGNPIICKPQYRKEDKVYENYAQLRDDRHMNDLQVAKETGIGATTLYEWKAGKYTPKVDKLAKIAKLFNVPIEALLGE